MVLYFQSELASELIRVDHISYVSTPRVRDSGDDIKRSKFSIVVLGNFTPITVDGPHSQVKKEYMSLVKLMTKIGPIYNTETLEELPDGLGHWEWKESK